jgi:transcription initiation factor TFIIE subunit alpha
MDTARVLVRQAVRAFFSIDEILVIEALVFYSCLGDDDLSYVVKIPIKELRKVCAGLDKAHFLRIATQMERAENKPRPSPKIYYYIDYPSTVDAIKWRWYKCNTEAHETTTAADEVKEFHCKRCKSDWTQYEVLDKFSAEGFLCHRCGHVLTKEVQRENPGHQKSARMNNQFAFMSEALQMIDVTAIPPCTFESAKHNMLLVKRAVQDEVVAREVVTMDAAKPTAVKGMANTGPKTMQITITDISEEQEAAEENRRRKEQLAANALPSWITDASVPTGGASATSSMSGVTRKMDFEDDGAVPAKKVKLEVKEEEDMDDEEMEFEDVM